MTELPQDPDLVATSCRHIGQPCPAAVQLARNLHDCARLAQRASPDFELMGFTHLSGCARNCPARFSLSCEGVALYCGVPPDADCDALARFAAAFLDTERDAMTDEILPGPVSFVVSGNGRSPARRPEHAPIC